MSEIVCRLEKVTEGSDVAITVGDRLTLSCDGEMPTALKEDAQFVFDESQAHALHVLDVVESTPQNIKLNVAGYRAGAFTDQKLVISDGTTTIETAPLTWQVASVLEQGQEPKPFPSEGPFYLSLPLWFWLTISAVVLAVVTFFLVFVYKRNQRRKLRAELEKYKTMSSPFAQFSRDMRLVRRQIGQTKSDDQAGEIFTKIDNDFRLYLVRELMVPAIQWPDSQVLREIRREHPALYAELQSDFKRALTELNRAKSDLKGLKLRDCDDLSMLLRKVAEHVYESRRKSS